MTIFTTISCWPLKPGALYRTPYQTEYRRVPRPSQEVDHKDDGGVSDNSWKRLPINSILLCVKWNPKIYQGRYNQSIFLWNEQLIMIEPWSLRIPLDAALEEVLQP